MFDVIIIGAGISGLFCLKHLLDEGINNVLVLDKNKHPFGVWDIRNDHSVTKNTYTVSSKLYMTISDFPMPKSMPEFLHHSQVLKYYNDYAAHNNLLQYVRNNVKIISSTKNGECWNVVSNNNIWQCRNLIISTGTVNDCLNIPKDKIFDNFKGVKIHSDIFNKSTKKDNITSKNILIIGGSDTGCDLAIDLANKNNSVTVSLKNGAWFQNRMFGAYAPSDMLYNRFLNFNIKHIIGKTYIHHYFGDNSNQHIDFWWGKGGSGVKLWEPKCKYLNSYYIKSREILEYISKGRVIPANGVFHIDDNKVTFGNGYSDNYDYIIFCTGYLPKYAPFLNDIYMQANYKHIFSCVESTLYFVGYIRPYLTSIPMLSELQSRWVAKVISAKCQLPSVPYMINDIKISRDKQIKEFPCSYKRISTIVDPYDYCDMVAQNIGAYPNLYNMYFTNYNLYKMLVYGSWNHHVYRLNDKPVNAIQSIQETYDSPSSIKIRSIIEQSMHNYSVMLIIFIVFIGCYITVATSVKFLNKKENVKIDNTNINENGLYLK